MDNEITKKDMFYYEIKRNIDLHANDPDGRFTYEDALDIARGYGLSDYFWDNVEDILFEDFPELF